MPTLYGRRSSTEKVRKHITELRIGNPNKNIAPLGVTQISKKLGLSRETIYQYLRAANKHGEIMSDDSGKIKINTNLVETKNFTEFSQAHSIMNDEIVKGWISKTSTMGHGGNGVRALRTHIQGIQKICNILKIQPIQLTLDFETSEKYAQSYFDMLNSGEISRRMSRKMSSPQQAFYQIRMAIRHLMQYNSRNPIAIPKGTSGILAGKIIGHGNYSDIALSDDEILAAEKYIIDTYGLDSDIYRVFFVGIESCARKTALMNMALNYTEDMDDDGNVTFFMNVIETKTAHILGGKFDKFIQRKKTQESLSLAKGRGQKLLWSEQSYYKAYMNLAKQLREIYKFLGKTDHYFFEEVFHSLRHIGAHYWLRKTNYNYGMVAEIGGWHTIDELKKSYGKMPPNIMMKMLKSARHGLDEI